MSKLSRAFPFILVSKAAAAVAVLGLTATGASAALVSNWTAWAVGTGTSSESGGTVSMTAGTNASPVWTSGQSGNKAYYSTDALNGERVDVLNSLHYNCVTYCGNNGIGPGGPYVNIYVVDPNNAANKAILLVIPGGPDTQGDFHFSLDLFRVNESVGTANWLAANGTDVAWTAVKDLYIGNGTYAGQVAPIAGFSGPGADDGFALAWGNRGGDPVYQPVSINGITLDVPEPASLALVGLALLGLTALRRRA